MKFEWDYAKEAENIRKHGVSFTEAVESFSDPNGIALVDKKHSEIEGRHYWVGKSALGKILTTRFTRRGERTRIFGCAEWRKFRRIYYEATKTR